MSGSAFLVHVTFLLGLQSPVVEQPDRFICRIQLDDQALGPFGFPYRCPITQNGKQYLTMFGYELLYPPPRGLPKRAQLTLFPSSDSKKYIILQQRSLRVTTGEIFPLFGQLFLSTLDHSSLTLDRVTDLVPQDYRPTPGRLAVLAAPHALRRYANVFRVVKIHADPDGEEHVAEFLRWRRTPEKPVIGAYFPKKFRVGDIVIRPGDIRTKDDLGFRITRIVPPRKLELPNRRSPATCPGWVEFDPVPVGDASE